MISVGDGGGVSAWVVVNVDVGVGVDVEVGVDVPVGEVMGSGERDSALWESASDW